jgi:predicted translin family RNA/ssDNA-binding protein
VPASLTPLQHQFTLFARVLDARNDRREQIFHASRELTRASKKLITQLQRCTVASEAERHKLLSSARSRELAELHRLLHACVSSFSCPSDYYRFSSAFSPGVQEFVEAASFLHYLEHPGEMITQQTIEDDINRTLEADKEKHAATTAVEQQNQQPQQQQEPAGSALSLPKPPPPPPTRITLPLSDYILGVTDLGGELMRYATNSVTLGAAGRVVVEQVGSFLRQGHAAFQLLVATLPPGGGAQFRDLGKKLEVWLQSVQKLELLAYRLHIRAAEFPEGEVGARMLAQALLIQDGGGGAGRGGGDDEREAGGAADD